MKAKEVFLPIDADGSPSEQLSLHLALPGTLVLVGPFDILIAVFLGYFMVVV
jgi:hypothetical protein